MKEKKENEGKSADDPKTMPLRKSEKNCAMP